MQHAAESRRAASRPRLAATINALCRKQVRDPPTESAASDGTAKLPLQLQEGQTGPGAEAGRPQSAEVRFQ